MPPVYNLATINGRLQTVINNIDANGNGFLNLLANSTVISKIQLARPSATISGGVLTFSGTLLDPAAVGTGSINAGQITDGNGTIVVSGLTAGIPLSGLDITIANGVNTTLISSGQAVQVLVAQITGS